MTRAGRSPASPTVLNGPVQTQVSPSVIHLIRQVVRRRPHAVAIESGEVQWSFAELWKHAELVGSALKDLGVGPGDRVGVWAERTPTVISAMLAVMTRGAAYVPVDPSYPMDRVAAIFDAADMTIMVHDSSAGAHGCPESAVPRLDLAGLATSDGAQALDMPRGEDIAYVIFTSGSTGRPKGVQIEHRSLANYAQWCAQVVGEEGDETPLFGSLGFDHSLTSLWPTLARGHRVVIAGGTWDLETLFARTRGRYTFMKVTPSHLRFFERTGAPDYGASVHLLMSGGEALEPSLIAGLGNRVSGLRMMNHYGPTETTIGCVHHVFDPARLPKLPSIPIGRPIWNTRAYLVDSDLRPVAPGEPADLVVAGAGVAAGYLGTAPDDRFISETEVGGKPGRAYRTGDVVELLPDDTLLYLGRRDDQVKISGYRIELGELRHHTLNVVGVADAAFEIVHVGGTASVEAFVIPSEVHPHASHDVEAAVRLSLQRMLPPPALPRRVHLVPELMLNTHGKVDLAATRLHFATP